MREPELTRADQAIGDGDHGLGMARGFNAAVGALDGLADGVTPGGGVLRGWAGRADEGGRGFGGGVRVVLLGGGKALGDAAEVDEAGLGRVGLRGGGGGG